MGGKEDFAIWNNRSKGRKEDSAHSLKLGPTTSVFLNHPNYKISFIHTITQYVHQELGCEYQGRWALWHWVGEIIPSDFQQKEEGGLCQKLGSFQKAIWNTWQNGITTCTGRDSELNMARGGERGRSWNTVTDNWKQGKNWPEFYTLYLPSTFSVVPATFTLFVLERTLLLSYSSDKHWSLILKFWDFVTLFSKLGNNSVTELQRSCVLSFLFCQKGILLTGGGNT